MKTEEIKRLAEMARLDIDDSEIKEISDTFGSILDYVGQIQEVSDGSLKSEEPDEFIPFNITREDVVMQNNPKSRENIIKQFPDKDNDFLKVKQIL